jgi:hypothetical protein
MTTRTPQARSARPTKTEPVLTFSIALMMRLATYRSRCLRSLCSPIRCSNSACWTSTGGQKKIPSDLLLPAFDGAQQHYRITTASDRQGTVFAFQP